jgi:diacylglycerol O-acyltransferase
MDVLARFGRPCIQLDLRRRDDPGGVAMATTEALSPLDAVFLHAEDDGIPMHMASIGIFESRPLEDATGELRLEDLRRLISSRLHLVPKLRQRARPGLLGGAPPTWNDDPEFDLTAHVRQERLAAPGTEEQLLEFCGELLGAPLDPSRPLWDLTFVTGLDGGRVAVVERLHHSMADGIAAAELAMLLLDLSPEVTSTPAPQPWVPRPPASSLGEITRDLQRLFDIPLQFARWLGEGVLHPFQRVRDAVRFAQSSTALVPTHLVAPPSSLNRPNGPGREVHLVRMDLESVRAVAHQHGTTINDVVLTIVAGGLHELLAARGDLAGTPELQALVPVGLAVGTGRQIGNAVSAFLVRLPVHESDPTAALATIATATTAQKHQHQELVPSVAQRLLSPLPQPVLSLSAWFLRHQPFFNLIVTNVPGPDVPLYALGARMLEAFPIVPLAGNQGLGIAALSYAGSLTFGVFSDPDVCPDVAVFCDAAVSTLRQLTGP